MLSMSTVLCICKGESEADSKEFQKSSSKDGFDTKVYSDIRTAAGDHANKDSISW